MEVFILYRDTNTTGYCSHCIGLSIRLGLGLGLCQCEGSVKPCSDRVKETIFFHVSNFYRPQTKFAKVMFLQVCLSVHRWGGVHGMWHGGCAWQGAYMTGGMRGGGVCMAGGGGMRATADTTGYGQ